VTHASRLSARVFFVGVALACSLAALGGEGVWTSGGPRSADGAFISSIVIDPVAPSTAYAAVFAAGVLKTTDSGATWKPANHGITDMNLSALTVDPVSSKIIYGGSSEGQVFRSTNSGETWTKADVTPGIPIYSLAVDTSAPTNIFAGTNSHSGLYKSTDSGGTWKNAGDFGPIRVLAIDPTTPSTLYAGTFGVSGTVFRSTDSGGTWARAGIGIETGYLTAIAIDPTTPSTLYAGTLVGAHRVYRSTDSGTSWTAASSGLGENFGPSSLLVDRATRSTLYAGGYDGVFKSTNSGGSWMPVNAGLARTDVNVVVLNPIDPGELYAGTGGGVFRSTNGGQAWEPATPLVANLSVEILAVGGVPIRNAYAMSPGQGVFRSADSGESWGATNAGLTSLSVLGFAVDPIDRSALLAATQKGVFKSRDSGNTWSQIADESVQVHDLVIDPANPSNVYAASLSPGNGILRSTDSGDTWSNRGLPNISVSALAIDARNPSTLFAGGGATDSTGGRGVFRTTDSGGTWYPTSAGLTSLLVFALAVDPMTPSTVLAGTAKGVFKSTDSGASWIPLARGLPDLSVNAIVFDPDMRSTIYAAVDSAGVFRSTDSGARWESMNTGLPSGNVAALALDPAAKILYAGVTGESVWQISLPPLNVVTVPIVLSTPGLVGSFFTSELTLTNPGTEAVSVALDYAPAFGNGAPGSGSEILPAGAQRVIPNAIEYLRGLGIPVGDTESRGGTLRIAFGGAGAATVRTTTATASGRAGLAYAGVPTPRLRRGATQVCGLRQNAFDRSNVAVLNAGLPTEGPITVALGLFSGDPASSGAWGPPEFQLWPGEFRQFSGAGVSNGVPWTNGFVRVRVSGAAPYIAYGVINDQVTSDGSFVEGTPSRVGDSPLRFTLPVLVESSVFSSELIVTNLSAYPRALHATWVASSLSGGRVSFDLNLLPQEQQILPAVVQTLRARGVVTDASGPTFAGALFVSADPTRDSEGVCVAARTSTASDGGRYGVFYGAVAEGDEATSGAWLYGLRQDSQNRTNLALVNVGSRDASDDTFRIEIFDGSSGRKAATIEGVTVPARGFLQMNALLANETPSVSEGYALVTRTTGNNPFIAYAVINDGGQPGERSGDGTVIKGEPSDAP